VHAALFASGGKPAADDSFDAELSEERVWLAAREQALASKENELSAAAVRLLYLLYLFPFIKSTRPTTSKGFRVLPPAADPSHHFFSVGCFTCA
jgi:hypothetical protein